MSDYGRAPAGDGKTVAVGPRGERVNVRTVDGRTIMVSRRYLELHPDEVTLIDETLPPKGKAGQ